jgi:hypothetical protein
MVMKNGDSMVIQCWFSGDLVGLNGDSMLISSDFMLIYEFSHGFFSQFNSNGIRWPTLATPTGYPSHREARFVGKLVRKSFRLNDMTIIYPYNVRPPNDVCWFISPRNYRYKML